MMRRRKMRICIRSKRLQQKLGTRHGSCVSPPTGETWRSPLKTSPQWRFVQQAIYRWRRDLTSMAWRVTQDFTRWRGRSTARPCSREAARLKLEFQNIRCSRGRSAGLARGALRRRIPIRSSRRYRCFATPTALWWLTPAQQLMSWRTGIRRPKNRSHRSISLIRFRKANDPGHNVFHVSDDGSVVETGYYESPSRPLRLDLSALTVKQLDAPTPDFAGWQSMEGDLRVDHFVYSGHPDLNGRPLGIEPTDTAYSVDVRHNRVLLGSESALSLFDASAHKTWSVPTPAALRVAQSPDGRLVVAALRDGTVRWYRASDGVELLALFLHADGKRWVAFTPSGYYAAGPGGEDLVGWQVDNGPDQAAGFFPASRFRDYFYRPDVVSLVLKTLDEAEAVRQAETATRSMRRRSRRQRSRQRARSLSRRSRRQRSRRRPRSLSPQSRRQRSRRGPRSLRRQSRRQRSRRRPRSLRRQSRRQRSRRRPRSLRRRSRRQRSRRRPRSLRPKAGGSGTGAGRAA